MECVSEVGGLIPPAMSGELLDGWPQGSVSMASPSPTIPVNCPVHASHHCHVESHILPLQGPGAILPDNSNPLNVSFTTPPHKTMTGRVLHTSQLPQLMLLPPPPSEHELIRPALLDSQIQLSDIGEKE